MIALSYNPITGAQYHFEPIKYKTRLRNRNPLIDKKAAKQLEIAAKNAAMTVRQLGEALGKIKPKP